MNKNGYITSEELAFFLDVLNQDVQEEEIDLIIYDFLTVYAKWLVRYLDIQHEKGRLSRSPPKRIMCSPSFMQEKDVFPNEHEKKFQIMPKLSLRLLLGLLLFYIRYFFFCRKYELNFWENLFNLAFHSKEEFNLCFVVPELHPRAHLFPKNVKFIGSCAGKSARFREMSFKKFVVTKGFFLKSWTSEITK